MQQWKLVKLRFEKISYQPDIPFNNIMIECLNLPAKKNNQNIIFLFL